MLIIIAVIIKNREKVVSKLKLAPIEKAAFLDKKLNKVEEERLIFEDSKFQYIARWYNYAILELSFIKNHKALPGWIGKKLGVDTSEIREALKVLKRLFIPSSS